MARLETTEVQLQHRGCEPDAPPLTFVHLSDLHLRRWGAEHERLAEAVNARDADFIFVTGDLLSDRPAALECATRLFRLLQCRHGAFLVRGNWEAAWGPPLREFRAIVRGWGATLLVNESRVVPARAGEVRVIGVDDLNRGWPDLSSALSADGARPIFSVLLSHAPLVASLLPAQHTVDLVLSGHTHGGQVRVPLLWRWLLPAGHGGFTDGLFELGHVRLYVSRGFGGVGWVPVRLLCPPELTVFRVVARVP